MFSLTLRLTRALSVHQTANNFGTKYRETIQKDFETRWSFTSFRGFSVACHFAAFSHCFFEKLSRENEHKT